jgi:hypothetical protein
MLRLETDLLYSGELSLKVATFVVACVSAEVPNLVQVLLRALSAPQVVYSVLCHHPNLIQGPKKHHLSNCTSSCSSGTSILIFQIPKKVGAELALLDILN